MKKNKGEYGYRDSNKKMRVILIAVFAAAILAQVIARQLASSQAAKNVLTVMAILTVLPMANIASPTLASWKYATIPETLYQRLRPYEERCLILYDLILTTKEQIIGADAAAVHPMGVILLCPDKRLKTAKAEEALNQVFQANHLKLHIKIFQDEKGFFRRLDQLKPLPDQEGTAAYAARILKSQSM